MKPSTDLPTRVRPRPHSIAGGSMTMLRRAFGQRGQRMLISGLLATALSSGCHENPTAPALSIMLDNANVTLSGGGSQEFTATVTNAVGQASVTWSLSGTGCSGAACGTLSATTTASGEAVLYSAPFTPPNPGTVRVIATTGAPHHESASATVSIILPVVAVFVNPPVAGVNLNGVQDFIASVGDDTSQAGVTWTLSGVGCSGAACGTLSASATASGGVVTYTAPTARPSPVNVMVTATSVTDHTKSASATVSVGSTIAVGVAPTGFTGVDVDGKQPFTAEVTNDIGSSGVTWSVTGTGCSGAACGTIAANGTYTAPAMVPNPATVTVIATSVADITKSARVTAVITTPGVITVVVSPTAATVCVGLETYRCGGSSSRTRSIFAYVFNDPSGAGVNWSVVGRGTITPATSANGVPSTYRAVGSVFGIDTVVATSATDGARRAVSVVRLVD